MLNYFKAEVVLLPLLFRVMNGSMWKDAFTVLLWWIGILASLTLSKVPFYKQSFLGCRAVFWKAVFQFSVYQQSCFVSFKIFCLGGSSRIFTSMSCSIWKDVSSSKAWDSLERNCLAVLKYLRLCCNCMT